MKIVYPHNHSIEEVHDIFDSYFDELTTRKIRQGYIQSAEKSWNPQGNIMNIVVSAYDRTRTAQAIIDKDKVTIKFKIPVIALPFATPVKREIIKKLEDLL